MNTSRAPGSATESGARRIFVRLSIASIFLAPIVISASLAVRYFCPLPIWDYWDVLHLAAIIPDLNVSTLFDLIWVHFVDQRMVFPKVAICGLARLTQNGHYALEIALGFVSQLLVLGILLHLMRPLRDGPRAAGTFLLLVTPYLLFWPVQQFRFQHHWFSTQYSLVLAPGVLALFALVRWRGEWRGLLSGMFFAVVSGYSHGTGAFLSVAIGIALFIHPGWTRTQMAVWWLWTAGLIVSIKTGMPGREALRVSPLTAILSEPLEFLRFFLSCLAPSSQPLAVGILLFVLTLVGMTILWRSGRLRDPAVFPMTILFLWTLIAAFSTTLFRGASGIHPSHYYFSFFVLFPLVVCHLIVHVSRFRTVGTARLLAHPVTRIVLLTAFVVVYTDGTVLGLRDARKRHKQVTRAVARLHDRSIITYDDVRNLYPYPRIVYALLALRDKGFLPWIGVGQSHRQVSVRFLDLEREGVEVCAGSPRGVWLRGRKTLSYVVLGLDPPIENLAAVSLNLALLRSVEARLHWKDTQGWSGPLLPGISKMRGDRSLWFRLPEGERHHLPVTALRLDFVVPEPGSWIGLFSGIRVWVR